MNKQTGDMTNDELMDFIFELQEENSRYEIKLDQLTNNWNELEEWVKNDKEKAMVNFEFGRCFNMFDILDKMKEIQNGSDKE